MEANRWGNSRHGYGIISIFLHWFMALGLIGLYFLGDYMVELDYYHPWYHDSLSLHKAIGILLAVFWLVRIGWTFLQTQPADLNAEHVWQNRFAHLAHVALYSLILLMIITGYLISTAKGEGISVFGWFEIPALLADNADRGELAGEIHEISTKLFMLLVIAHAAAALLHHFYYKDKTLLRMLRIQKT